MDKYSLGAWINICLLQKLSEQFIKKHIKNIDWACISACQKLSEDFIIEYKDKVDWGGLSINQNFNLSDDFIRQYRDNNSITKTIPLYLQ